MADEGFAVTALMPGQGTYGKDPKCEEDFAALAAEALEKSNTLDSAGRPDEAVNVLLDVELKARKAYDAVTVSMLCIAVLRIHQKRQNWTELMDTLSALCKKRGQLKRPTTDMVDLCMDLTKANAPERAVMGPQMLEQFLGRISSLTEDKIFLEVQRARAVRLLSNLKEVAGDFEGAASLMQEIQVETFGTMERLEKTEFILEQVRLALANNWYPRAQILSKKINHKLMNAADLQDLKLLYYEYMVLIHMEDNNHIEVAKCYYQMFLTPKVAEDPQKWQSVLRCYVLSLILAPYGNEQRDLLHKIDSTEKKKLKELPVTARLLRQFLTKNLLEWPLKYETELKAHQTFGGVEGAARWDMLRIRVLQHNLLLVGECYSCVTLTRVAELLRCSREEAEAQITELVNNKLLHAKMNRPDDRVVFGAWMSANERLDVWTRDVARVLDLLDDSHVLISKERMIAAARKKTAAA